MPRRPANKRPEESLDFVMAHRRVRVTACSWRSERSLLRDSVRFRDSSTRQILRTPTGTGAQQLHNRVRMEAGRSGDGESGKRQSETACGSKEIEDPLSRFPTGESRGGRVPPTPPKPGGSPRKRARPLARSPNGSSKILLDTDRLLMEAMSEAIGVSRFLVYSRTHGRRSVSPLLLPQQS